MSFRSRRQEFNEFGHHPRLERLAGRDWLVGPVVEHSPWFIAHRVRSPEGVAARDAEFRMVRTARLASRPLQDAASQALCRLVMAAELVRHQGVLPVVASDLDRPPFGLVFPWMPHQTLGTWRDEQGELSLSRVLWIARQIAEVIGASHERQRAHLHLKPEHVLICSRHRVVIVGWSQSRWFGDRVTADDVARQAGPFQDPQFARTKIVSGSEDVFSLGALIFFLVAGSPNDSRTWRGERPAGEYPWPKLHKVEPRCPGELSELVAGMLAIKASLRPSIRVVLDELLGMEIDHLSDDRVLGNTRYGG